MTWYKRQSLLDQSFRATIILKGIDGVLEIVGGLIVFWISPRSVNRLVATLTQHELSEDPHDLIATHLLTASHGLAHGGNIVASLYLLFHGMAKCALVVALFYEKLWAYPSMIALLFLFVAYQLYQISYSHSVGLILLTLFDILVVWLTWKEYNKQKVALAMKTERA
ncbi:MAG: DUF2127 domain-containing protein [Terriglobales bacterium]